MTSLYFATSSALDVEGGKGDVLLLSNAPPGQATLPPLITVRLSDPSLVDRAGARGAIVIHMEESARYAAPQLGGEESPGAR